ncbi:MAG: FAD-binding oxidoreductase [Methanobacteriota archaeon]|nr:MAG: FAD-binding oxidoreductase [Euryarchaeota archaeon]
MVELKNRYSFSIIGGGVIGCSVAYHLSEELGEEVVLLERDFIASGSSGLSAGILSQQLWNEIDIGLVKKSIDWIKKVSEEEEGFGIHQDGLLKLVCTEMEVELLKRNVDLQNSVGCDVRYLEPDEVEETAPEIAVSDVVGATYCPDDSYVDPYQLCIQFAKRAEANGVRFLQKSQVNEVEMKNGGPFRLRTTQDVLESDVAILCTGPWSKKVGKMLGVDLPLKPYRTQVAITTPFMGDAVIPMVHDVTNSFYMKPETGGTVLAGNGTEDTESDPDDFKERAGFDFMTSISEKMLGRLPRSEKASLVRGWAGLCTATPDRRPLIGFHSEAKALFLAVGMNALGVMRAPAIGEIVSDLILERKTQSDFQEFDPNRFGEVEDFEIVQGFTL